MAVAAGESVTAAEAREAGAAWATGWHARGRWAERAPVLGIWYVI
ncbi:hypothetical protein ACFP0N_39605 [Kitasatospora aburaviensis]|uniref:Uncharacterized protein n=1 Tax=Kitasatospora aburaviensis TaxID=67265 RepID=A0ABW1F9G2_9ACTN